MKPLRESAGRESEGRLYVQSLEKGLAVLMAFDPQHETLNLREMAHAAGISKSAAQRFAFTLERLGYLSKDPVSKRYTLAPRVLELGFQYLLTDRLVERSNPYLLDLNRRCQETLNLARPEGHDMVYVGRFPSFRTMPVYMPLGRRLPMFCTSAGRAYLAALPPAEASELIEKTKRLRYTPTTVTDTGELNEMLAQARERGFSVANGEYFQGDLGIGVALRGPAGRPVAAVNISASSARWTLERMIDELVPELLDTVAKIDSRPPSAADVEPFMLGLRDLTGDSP